METKVTTASVRVMLSHQFCNFEVVMGLENPEGIALEELTQIRKTCQGLATDAVNEYKSNPAMNPKNELHKVEKKLEEIKSFVNKKYDQPDPKAEEEIKNLPAYQKPEVAKPVTKSKR